ncbi:MAG: hypothetical protein ACK4KW_10215 [Gemmobacter sp.]
MRFHLGVIEDRATDPRAQRSPAQPARLPGLEAGVVASGSMPEVIVSDFRLSGGRSGLALLAVLRSRPGARFGRAGV